MRRLFSFSVASTCTFILSVLAILVIAVSAPGMVQAVLGPAPASSGDVQVGNSIMAAGDKMTGLSPAGLSDTGIFGTVGIGTASPAGPLHVYSKTSTQPETIDLDGAQPITAQWNDYCDTGGAFSGSGFLARFARGGLSSPANVQTGDRLGFNVFGGWVGGAFRHTGAIEALVDSGTVSGSSLPTYMKFSTTPAGSTTRVEAMRISSSGNVGIGTLYPEPYRLQVVSTSGDALYAISSYAGGTGVAGNGNSGIGVDGSSTSGMGVWGHSTLGPGVKGISVTGVGVHGEVSTNEGTGVYGQGGKYAGYFNGYTYVSGNCTVTGQMFKGGGAFKIDHPLDPENKYLQHSFVESPDMMNIYNGNVVLNEKGEALVELPAYFDALNRDFRYQLTAIGAPGPNLYVAQKVAGNQFKIAGGSPGMEVSWQVTGVRQDAFAKAHPIIVEQEKPANEKGLYLHPIEWGQPKEKGISTALNK